MLILTRRVGETVMIGNDVTVTVLGVKGNQVRIGINAPKNVAVHREEIYERIKREQQGEQQERARRESKLDQRVRGSVGPATRTSPELDRPRYAGTELLSYHDAPGTGGSIRDRASI